MSYIMYSKLQFVWTKLRPRQLMCNKDSETEEWPFYTIIDTVYEIIFCKYGIQGNFYWPCINDVLLKNSIESDIFVLE